MERTAASLYIHIPFCAGAKCDYCDFYSVPLHPPGDAAMLDAYIGILLGDIKDQLELFAIDDVPTVYIGGGTPSALGAGRIERLLAGLQALLEPMQKPPRECTVEANPESADEGFLKACASGGATRLSLGVQTFHEPSRRAVRREGSIALVEERLALAAEYFSGSLSVDLITGLPFQTIDIVLRDIEHTLDFQPGHVSLYSLTLEPETPLGRQGRLSLPSGDEADRLWVGGRDRLEQAGLAQYEVSNFSLPGKTCAHNIRYWRMENWLGAGPAASGTIIDDASGTGRRFTYYQRDIKAYLASQKHRIHYTAIEEISRASLIRETMLMGFRYRAGPDPILFEKRFKCRIEDCIPQTIARWRGRGFFKENTNNSLAVSLADSLEVSRSGMLFLNRFLVDAFSEMEKSAPGAV